MMARFMPRRKPWAASPQARARTSSATCDQVQLCQMPRSFSRMATRPGRTRACCNSSFGKVSAASHEASADCSKGSPPQVDTASTLHQQVVPIFSELTMRMLWEALLVRAWRDLSEQRQRNDRNDEERPVGPGVHTRPAPRQGVRHKNPPEEREAGDEHGPPRPA